MKELRYITKIITVNNSYAITVNNLDAIIVTTVTTGLGAQLQWSLSQSRCYFSGDISVLLQQVISVLPQQIILVLAAEERPRQSFEAKEDRSGRGLVSCSWSGTKVKGLGLGISQLESL